MNNLMRDRTLRRVTEANPVPTSTLTADESARAELLLQDLSATSRPARSGTSKRWGTKARALVGGGVALLAAAVGGGLLVTAPASAEQILLEAASNAALQPVEEGRYWYVRTEVDTSVTVPYQREIWLARDGGVLRDEFLAAEAAELDGSEVLDPALIRNQDLGQNYTDPEADGTTTFGDNVSVTWDELEELPSDPEALSALLTERVTETSHGDAYDLWDASTGLLRESPARPELRRGLWEVIATIPGVTLDGPTTDATGRDGTAVSIDFSSQNLGRYALVLDPSDGRLLETRYLDNDGALLHTGTVVEQSPRDFAPKAQSPVCGPGSEPERSC
ncbi:hypothetical protein APR04_002734 [Promicromonospora umidemergens]|uniref:CU044_5270 family protein n=1 Tax=Promicromonospora umidemergens TaxID=629679 RepID=A0ABP8WKA5_9MICO|nr:CU044_5270 family protein [Promicromonospora umidemergens]MCP2283821.1 hypothetical protein [Promicromonospora umidemergens]